jgi:HEAT repeat protein
MVTLAEAPGQQSTEPQVVADVLVRRQQDGKPQHLVLLSEPGAGKTTLLHKLLLRYVQEGQLPLFIRSFEWDRIDTLESWIESGAYLEGKNTPEGFGSLLLQYVREGKAPVLLDGLDEVRARDKVIARIQDFAGGVGKNAVILATCRTAVYWNALSSFNALELSPFEWHEVQQYVKARLQERADEFLANIEGDAAMRRLVGNGLMLAMMTHLYARGQVQLPTSKDELYEQIEQFFLSDPQGLGRPLRHPNIYPLALKRALLEEISFHTYFCRQRQQEMPERYVLAALRRLTATQNWRKYRGLEDDLLKDILLNSGLLFQRGLGEPIRFFHATLQEYFAARFAVARWNDDDPTWHAWLPNRAHWQWNEEETFACPQGCDNPLPTFAVMVTKPEYREVLLLLIGMLDDRARAEVFLSGLAAELPFLYGLREPSHAPQRYKVWFAKPDDNRQRFPDEAETPSSLNCDPPLPGYVETMILCDRIQTQLQFALHALSHCPHGFPDLLHNVLQGLESVSWRSSNDNDEAFTALGQARTAAIRQAAIRRYLEHLQDQRLPVEVRAFAARALGGIGDARAVNPLIQALTDPQVRAWLRGDAAWALGEIGDDRASEALSKIILQHTPREERGPMDAMWALTKIGSDRAIDALCQIMRDPQADEEVRSDVAQALGKIRNARTAEALFQMMTDPLADKKVRRSSAETLAENRDHRAIETLLKALIEPQEEPADFYWIGILNLCKTGDARAIDTLCQIVRDPRKGEELRSLVAQALRHIPIPDDRVINALFQVVTDPKLTARVRIHALWAFTNMGSTGEYCATDALLQLLIDPQIEAWVRKNAAAALGQFGGDGAKNRLYRVMTDTQVEEQTRRLAAGALGSIGDPRAAALLFREMTDSQVEEVDRYLAAATLGKIGDVRAVDLLLRGLTDPQIATRLPGWFPYAATWALGTIGDDCAFEALSQVMTSPQVEYSIRASAASALGEIHNPRATDALLQVLTDRQVEAQIRMNAAKALGPIGGDRAVEAVFQALTDLQADENFRSALAEVLADIGDNRAIDALKEFAENKNVMEWERREAVEILLRIDFSNVI